MNCRLLSDRAIVSASARDLESSLLPNPSCLTARTLRHYRVVSRIASLRSCAPVFLSSHTTPLLSVSKRSLSRYVPACARGAALPAAEIRCAAFSLRATPLGQSARHSQAKSISDSGWGEFRTLIEYKTQWYGKRLIVIDRWHPSSKLCSTPGCDGKNSKLKLSDRSWTCLGCGTLHDRDLNAAKNIRAAGLAVIQRELDEACGEDVRPKQSPRVTPSNGRQTSVKQETTPNAHAHARASVA